MTKHSRIEPKRDSAAPEARSGGSAAHIAIVVHSLNAGGAQRRLATLANAFARAGRTVEFVALRGGGTVQSLLAPQVRLTVLNAAGKPPWKPWFFEGWARLARWLRSERPDVVIAGITTVHHSVLRACAALPGQRPRVMLRASRHPYRRFPWRRPFKRLFEPVERAARWRIYAQAEWVISVSRETAEVLRARLPGRGRVVELPNPVVTAAFARSLAKPAPHPWLAEDGAPVILAVGRLAWQKRFDLLLEALAIVRGTRPARLIILGEGRLRRRLERQMRALGLDEAVAMPGSVADVGAWMARADLLVSSSAFEGSPAVLIEALAAGLPVVATRCPGGSEELVADTSGPALVPMDDAGALADAILASLDAPRDPTALRAIAARYGEEASAAAYLAMLDEAVGAQRPARPAHRSPRGVEAR